jgi:hypothetical protein
MKKIIFIFIIVILASSCSTTSSTKKAPVTYDGLGGYQKLQQDRFECLQLAYGGDTSSITATDRKLEGETRRSCSGDIFLTCLGSRGWKRNNEGTGTPVATTVQCND